MAVCGQLAMRASVQQVPPNKNTRPKSGEEAGYCYAGRRFERTFREELRGVCTPHNARYRREAVCGQLACERPPQQVPPNKNTRLLSGIFIWWGKLDSDQRSQWQQIYSLPPLAAREFPHRVWSWWTESNHQPADYKSAALPLSHTSVLNIDYYSRKFFKCQYFFWKKWRFF